MNEETTGLAVADPAPAQLETILEQNAKLIEQNEFLLQFLRQRSDTLLKSSFHLAKVVDVDMPFGHLVGFMVKVGVASIPAAILLVLTYVVITGIFGGLLAAIF